MNYCYKKTLALLLVFLFFIISLSPIVSCNEKIELNIIKLKCKILIEWNNRIFTLCSLQSLWRSKLIYSGKLFDIMLWSFLYWFYLQLYFDGFNLIFQRNTEKINPFHNQLCSVRVYSSGNSADTPYATQGSGFN